MWCAEQSAIVPGADVKIIHQQKMGSARRIGTTTPQAAGMPSILSVAAHYGLFCFGMLPTLR